MHRRLALLCFFLSGFAGLVYEIAWIRKASLVFGSTSAALSTVLAVFFGGLALGAWLFGRLGQRTDRPIRWYAVLEFLLAVTALASPLLFGWIDGLYGSIWRGALDVVHDGEGLAWLSAAPGLGAARVALVALVLLIPTTFMGGTLPLFVRQFAVSRDRLGRDVGLLYGVNTLGAVAGTLAAGFLLLPAVGVVGSIRVAAGLNVVAGLIALGLKFRADTPTAGDAAAPDSDITPEALRRALPALFFVAGFLAIGAEVLWSRFLALVIRNSVITYTLTLATVLTGIVLGSLLASRLADRRRVLGIERPSWYGLLQLAAAVTAAGAMFLSADWWRGLGGGLAPIFMLMLPAAVFSGALFPLANRLLVTDANRSARDVGRMTALNTLGGILGAMLAGFVVLPHLGLAAGVRLLALIGLAAGTAALVAAGRRRLRWWPVAVTVAVLLGLVLPALWGARLPHDHLAVTGELVDVAEGRGATLAAVQVEDRRQLQIDRLWQGTDIKGHQIMAAHLPALLHGDPREVLVIGVGVGQTAGRFLMHGTEHLDCVDIEPEIFPFIDRNFPNEWLRQPAVTLVPEDGRTFTAHTDRRYDIVSVEVGQVFRPGVDVFYTREFYEEARRLLKPGGLVTQFVSLAFFDEPSFDAVVRTFLLVFPHASLWYNNEELLLVGSPERTPRLDPELMDPAVLPAAVRSDLMWAQAGGQDHYLHRPGALLGSFLADEEMLEPLTAEGEVLVDDRPTLAYATAGVQASDHLTVPLARLLSDHLSPLARGLVAGATADNALLALAATTRDLNLRDLAVNWMLDDAVSGTMEGRPATPEEVVTLLRTVVRINPGNFHGQYNLGKAYLLKGDPGSAQKPLARAAALRPDDGLARRDYGLALLQNQLTAEAIPELLAAVKLRPDDFAVHNYLGAAMGGMGDFASAERAFLRALELNPTDEAARRNLEHARRQK